MTELTRQVVNYQKTGAGLGTLIEEISQTVYGYPAGQSGFEPEDGAEFLLRFLPRIRRLINRYRDTGQTFESYLSATLRWQIKSFAAERAKSRLRTTALGGPGSDLCVKERERADHSATEVHEGLCSSLDACGGGANAAAVALTNGQRHRLLFLSLKLTEKLGEEEYRRVARAAGCEEEWLLSCWLSLRKRCERQRRRREENERHRDQAWFEMRCVQLRLRLTLEEEERRALVTRLEMWRRRHRAALAVLARMHNGPTHADIAHVLNVPKGTVDSCIFYAKCEADDPEKLNQLAAAVVIE